MSEQVKKHLEKYPKEIVEMFNSLRMMILDSASSELTETLWAKIPSYYVGDAFVRLIPFKDHVNVEARAILSHKEELTDYKITPKGMLQIYIKQSLPRETLKHIFAESLNERDETENEI